MTEEELLAELRETVAQLQNALALVVHAAGGEVTVSLRHADTLPWARVVATPTPEGDAYTLTLEEDR